MADVYTSIVDSLCTRYPALTPFEIRRQRLGDVFRLIDRVNQAERRKQGCRGRNDRVEIDKDGNRIVYREAQNNDWW